jgi:hypothetical protein
MELEERIKALEDEFLKESTETKQLMLEIRALLMESCSPLRGQMQNGKEAAQNGDGAKGIK